MNKSRYCILLSTYNGAKYLREQMESLFVQSDCSIVVRDDGSRDDTLAILRQYAQQGKIILYEGENAGPAASFLELLRLAPLADYYAFCDQDDVWKKNKVSAAVSALEEFPDELKCYYAAYTLVDESLNPMDGAHFDDVPPVIESVLGYNCAVGATMVISRRLRDVICSVSPPEVYMHDWWALLVCLALGGRVVKDDRSHLLYRQHGNNVVGCKRSIWKRIQNKLPGSREQQKLSGVRRKFASELLSAYGDRMPADVRARLLTWSSYRDCISKRIALAVRSFAVPYTEAKWKKHLFLALDILAGRF